MVLREENRRTRRKTCPSDTPQIPHGLTLARIRASAMRGQRLTAWAMAWPAFTYNPFIRFYLVWFTYTASSNKLQINEQIRPKSTVQQIFTLRMATAIFGETLDSSQYCMPFRPENRSFTVNPYVQLELGPFQWNLRTILHSLSWPFKTIAPFPEFLTSVNLPLLFPPSQLMTVAHCLTVSKFRREE
jgi:hypothetical protein